MMHSVQVDSASSTLVSSSGSDWPSSPTRVIRTAAAATCRRQSSIRGMVPARPCRREGLRRPDVETSADHVTLETPVRPSVLLGTAVTAALVLSAAAATAAPPSAQAAAAPFTTTPLVFTVEVGPGNDRVTCEIVGDLRVPAGVTADNPAPGAVLATNGFGGSKDSIGPNGNGAYAARFAEQGYVTLSYSGLGFGGSSCSIYVDDPVYDGQAGSQLVSFLGGAEGIAATADGEPFDIAGLVRLDAVSHDGTPKPHDPRVGMIGGSYGGQIQFSIARIDPRLDALAPIYTWNDLGYSLAPNNAGSVSPTAVTSETPGIWKSAWHSLFFGLGVAGPVIYPGNTPSSCGGYVEWVCRAYAENLALSIPSEQTREHVRQVSVGYHIPEVRIPVLLSQGQKDSLFNLNEAIATYDALRAQGNTVRMVWQSWGHTVGRPVPGELETGTLEPGSADLRATVQGQIFTDWMAHWLKDEPTDLGPPVRYFRDYAYTPPENADDQAGALAAARAAYAGAGGYPVGRPATYSLSGGDTLVAPGEPVEEGRASFVATGTTVPTNTGEVVFGPPPPQVDPPGTFAAWRSAPVAAPLDVAGVPELTVRFDAPQIAAAQNGGDAGKLQLFAKLFDVDPEGRRTLIRDLVSAVRVPDVAEPTRISLPGIVHRFDTGHSVELVLAASDATYKGAGLPGPVTVVDSAAAPNTLTLPVVGGAVAAPARLSAARMARR
jgi:predicted acyl esterase